MAYVQGVLGQMNICIVIPVYNESKGIGRLIEELKERSFQPLVVDDGSTDNSGEIARSKGALVIRHAKKMGKGVSLRDGFAYVLKKNYDAVITMDGDRQHDVSDIDQFIRKAQEADAGIITGTRMQNHRGMPLIRLWTSIEN